MKTNHPKGKLFNAARPYILEEIESYQKKQAAEEKFAADLAVTEQEEKHSAQKKRERIERNKQRTARYLSLPIELQQRIRQGAIERANSTYQRQRLQQWDDDRKPHAAFLDEMDRVLDQAA